MDPKNTIEISGEQFSLNVEKSPVDTRDYIAEAIFSSEITLPSTLDLRKDLFPIRNQGSQGSCSAQVAACMKEWQEKKDVALDEYMSPQFVYNNRENQDSSGMTPRDTMKILNKLGICREKEYPYGKIEPKEKISENVRASAIEFIIVSYASINTIDGLKTALYKNGPCYIAVPVYNSTTRMWKPSQGETLRGGHAMTVVGYTNEGFIIRNSWGDAWGEKGYCTLPYTDWGNQWEVWSTIDADSSRGDDDFNTPKNRWWRKIKAFFKGIGILGIIPLITMAFGVTTLIIGDGLEKIIGGVFLAIAVVFTIIVGIKKYKSENIYKTGR